MTSSPDWIWKMSNDLRVMGESLVRIGRMVHEHTRNLEIAVEGRYANDGSDPRVRLLSDALYVSRTADLELTRVDQALKRVLLTVQAQRNAVNQIALKSTFEQEREALTTHITSLKQEHNELEILYEIAQKLNSTLEFDEVLRLVMDRVIEFVSAERGFLMLVNPETDQPEFIIARDKDARSIPESAFATAKISRRTVLKVIQTQEPILTDDAQMDQAFNAQESVVAYGIRSIMCAPLVVRNKCIGAVYVDSRFNANLFLAKHRDLLLAFCNQAAIAIDNARLFKKVREDKEYMDNIFESIANGVITTDSTGIITAYNHAAHKIFMLDPEEVKGKHFEQVFSELPKELGLIGLLRNAQASHEPRVLRSVDVEIPGRDGGLCHLNFYVTSLRDIQESGESTHIGVALVIDDETDLKRSKAQAKQVRRLFERYVHPNVVQELIKNPMAVNLGGETKEISVVFADIRGYTRLSETIAPEEVMHLINRYLNIMCEAIWDEEGTITAFQGDALMAIFNAPLQQKTHALQAVRAAWKMRKAVLDYQRSQPQETQVAFGIGVNTGLATVGNVGSQGRLQNYTALGDVVNVASRIQNNVTDNNILLNESTYIQVYRYVNVGQAFALTVKNKVTPLTVRYLLGLP